MNSITEKQFASKELQGYFDEKLKRKYAEQLDENFDIRKGDAQRAAAQASKPWTKYAILALLLLLFAAAAYIFFGKSTQPTEDVMMAYRSELYTPVDINVRGSQSENEKLISQLFQSYERKDFETVIAEYESLKTGNAPYNLNVEQMAGVAYGSTAQYEQAITVFKAILDTPESTYSNHSTVRYLLGLTYLLNSDHANAVSIFNTIQPEDYKYSEVQTILRSIQ